MYWSLLWVLLLLAAFGALAWWLQRRYGRPVGDARIALVEARRLDATHTLWLVEVDGRRLLLGGGRDGLRLVADLTEGG